MPDPRLTEDGSVDPNRLSDAALVRLFAQSRDAEVFRELVERHGPLVLAACRRGLHSHADAEDAFQATFLVLARSAGKIRSRQSVASWLYGVATRVCLRMRRDSARRSTELLMDAADTTADPLDELLARHDGLVADEELAAMPERLRTPLVLRYLVGKSNAEVAEELGISVAALEGRLKRGKQALRMRLLRRGVTLATMVATLKATRVAAGNLPGELAESTISLAASGGTATISLAASEAGTSTHIALQELSAMSTTGLSMPVVAAAGTLTVVAALVTSQLAFSQGEGQAVNDPFGLDATVARADETGTEVQLQRSDAESRGELSDGGEGPTPLAPTAKFRNVGIGRSAGEDQPLSKATAEGVWSSAIPGVIDIKSRSASELAIEQALVKPLNSLGLDFQGAPLSEVVSYLISEYHIEVQVDAQALDDLGLSPDDPIHVTIRNIRLESALSVMLRQLDLTYAIKDDVLLVTSQENADSWFEVRTYPLTQLPGDAATIEQLITESVDPASWQGKGGAGSISTALLDYLVIRQTYRAHREINELLSQLKQTTTGDPLDARAIEAAELGKADHPTSPQLPPEASPQVDSLPSASSRDPFRSIEADDPFGF